MIKIFYYKSMLIIAFFFVYLHYIGRLKYKIILMIIVGIKPITIVTSPAITSGMEGIPCPIANRIIPATNTIPKETKIIIKFFKSLLFLGLLFNLFTFIYSNFFIFFISCYYCIVNNTKYTNTYTDYSNYN